MFTGLVQAVGQLRHVHERDGDLRMTFAVGNLPIDNLQVGESICTSGVCLTVVSFDAASFSADVSNETIVRTTLSRLSAGEPVNLERALLPSSRIGGHFVSGHVDGIGRLEKTWDDARSQGWRISAPRALLRYIAVKGSICVDGVSLTVNVADDSGFEFNLVPHTLASTSFAHARVGDDLNLEVDLVARYLERLMQVPECGA
ncbi:MAG: riboflavin synthase [Arenimonas sp.]